MTSRTGIVGGNRSGRLVVARLLGCALRFHGIWLGTQSVIPSNGVGGRQAFGRATALAMPLTVIFPKGFFSRPPFAITGANGR
jgi:hypothetical protein